jgi:uncharacterized phage protein (predicted DNA packaging)
MAALLTLDVAKQHLRVDHTDDDADITRKIDQASEIVLDYIKRSGPRPTDAEPEPPDWDEATVPPGIAAAVGLMLEELYDDRAAGGASNEVAMGYLPVKVTAILHRYRDPAIA